MPNQIHITLTPFDETRQYIDLQVDESMTPHLAISLQRNDPTDPDSYNAWYTVDGQSIRVDQIEVRYYKATSSFVLRGVTSDAATPEIFGVDHFASSKSNARVSWKYGATGIIDWTFASPASGWVGWSFNPEGTAPPVRVKVVLKRQS